MEELIDIYTRDRKRTGETIPREGAFLKEGQYMLYVLAILENLDGKFLITQRSHDKHWAGGWWEVTGGGVLSGETPLDAVKREVGEETGLNITGMDLEPVYSYENVDLARGDNYMVDIYHIRFDFSEQDITLQQSEAIDFKLATWKEICEINNRGEFLHFNRLCQYLGR
ncbi:MAG: NUDIX hydrolase [Coriobacteriales bacterium]|nr:NUDIX hydrolase [Coriobacteriales bacterium]